VYILIVIFTFKLYKQDCITITFDFDALLALLYE